jgi:hypothetical protein
MGKELKMADATPEELVGKFIVLWRSETKQPCRIVGLDMEAGKVRYEILAGVDKGKRFRSRFDKSQTVRVYDEGSLVLACLDT